MKLNPVEQSIKLPTTRNHQNHLYDEILVSVTVYYDIQFVQADQNPKLNLLINGESITKIVVEPPTIYSQSCSLFASDRMARYTLITEPFQVNDNVVNLELELEGVTRFGVSEATIFSIKKTTTENSELPQQPP